MKNLVPTFEGFLNEKRLDSWNNHDGAKVANEFDNDYGNDKKGTTSEDLDEWLNMFAQQYQIEDGLDYSFAEDLVNALNKMGFKKIKVDDLTLN